MQSSVLIAPASIVIVAMAADILDGNVSCSNLARRKSQYLYAVQVG